MIDNYDMIEDKEAALWDEIKKIQEELDDAHLLISKLMGERDEARTIACGAYFVPQYLTERAIKLVNEWASERKPAKGWGNDTK